jgi:hypothetical protein
MCRFGCNMHMYKCKHTCTSIYIMFPRCIQQYNNKIIKDVPLFFYKLILIGSVNIDVLDSQIGIQ